MPTAFERHSLKMTNTPNMKPESVSTDAKPAVAAPAANDIQKKADEKPAHAEPAKEPTKS